MSERWDRHFLDMALHHSNMSKDPATRVGAVVIGPDREFLSAGLNGFPRGIADTPERLNDREMKLKLIVHAEMNALLAAARTGMRLKGCSLFLAATDDSGEVWVVRPARAAQFRSFRQASPRSCRIPRKSNRSGTTTLSFRRSSFGKLASSIANWR